jgi:hypothetical protein
MPKLTVLAGFGAQDGSNGPGLPEVWNPSAHNGLIAKRGLEVVQQVIVGALPAHPHKIG